MSGRPCDRRRATRSELLTEHVWLVESIARAICRRYRWLPYADVYQDAFVGLLEAFHSFDAGRKVPFAAYARKWILGSALRGARQVHHSELELMFDPGAEPVLPAMDPLLFARVRRALDCVSLRDSVIFDLVIFGGLSYRETEALMETCLDTIQRSLRRTIRVLQDELAVQAAR